MKNGEWADRPLAIGKGFVVGSMSHGEPLMGYWLVATIRPNQMLRAIENLRSQSFETYAPRHLEVSVRRHRKVMVPRWLFPRYLFVDPSGESWGPIVNTRGVSGLIRFGDHEPSRIPSFVINSMMAREVNGMVKLPKVGRIRPGSRVTINTGNLKNFAGVYVGMTAQERELVLLDRLGRVELDAGSLDPV